MREYRLRHLRNLVDHAPVMKAIPKAMRRGVAMLFKVREVAAGTLLLDGSGKAGVFGVLGGRVRAEMRSEAGDFRMLAVMSQGAIFGGEEPVLGERLGLRYITARPGIHPAVTRRRVSSSSRGTSEFACVHRACRNSTAAPPKRSSQHRISSTVDSPPSLIYAAAVGRLTQR